MLRLAADQNFNDRILRGVRRMLPGVDIVHVYDIGLADAEDPVILAWAAEEGRILLTHDVATMTAYAHQRVAAGQPMPGVFGVPNRLAIGQAIAEIAALAGASEAAEWEGQVRYLPLR